MSYDVSVGKKDFNYTSNCSSVWYDHFPNGSGLAGLDGLTGRQANKEFEGFWENLSKTRHELYVDGASGEPALCRKYDSENGWGSFVGAIMFIGQIQSACMNKPNKKISIWF